MPSPPAHSAAISLVAVPGQQHILFRITALTRHQQFATGGPLLDGEHRGTLWLEWRS